MICAKLRICGRVVRSVGYCCTHTVEQVFCHCSARSAANQNFHSSPCGRRHFLFTYLLLAGNASRIRFDHDDRYIERAPKGELEVDHETFATREGSGLLSPTTAIKLIHSEVDLMHSIRATARLLAGGVIVPTMAAK